ncbi:hypothetical protein HanXRQr2_Chr14g0670441 [Helianthus annuus]|uniref:Uncharacterized protein n=1 Tax=Helianthus annuus TaxID=4232 RepID=A0A251SMF2_HELAN|nr:hypothetical protein HanXRQr2_Chr14g0670441 [Helianthus annuus]
MAKGGNKEASKTKPAAACAKTEPDLIASLTKEQYEQFQKHLAAANKSAQGEPLRTTSMAETNHPLPFPMEKTSRSKERAVIPCQTGQEYKTCYMFQHSLLTYYL